MRLVAGFRLFDDVESWGPPRIETSRRHHATPVQGHGTGMPWFQISTFTTPIKAGLFAR